MEDGKGQEIGVLKGREARETGANYPAMSSTSQEEKGLEPEMRVPEPPIPSSPFLITYYQTHVKINCGS